MVDQGHRASKLPTKPRPTAPIYSKPQTNTCLQVRGGHKVAGVQRLAQLQQLARHRLADLACEQVGGRVGGYSSFLLLSAGN